MESFTGALKDPNMMNGKLRELEKSSRAQTATAADGTIGDEEHVITNGNY